MAARSHRTRILVAGLGNLLLQDDGVGVHAARELRKSAPRGVTVLDAGTAILDALPFFERADKVLAIDAMQAGGEPGEIYAFRVDDVENPLAKASLHDFGLRSAFEFLNGRRPEVLVLGVEPERIEYGLELTPKVAGALPRLLEEVRAVVARWQSGVKNAIRG